MIQPDKPEDLIAGIIARESTLNREKLLTAHERLVLRFRARAIVTKLVGGDSMVRMQMVILGKTWLLPAFIARRRAIVRMNGASLNQIREGVLWRTELRRLLMQHRVKCQTYLSLLYSVRNTFLQM